MIKFLNAQIAAIKFHSQLWSGVWLHTARRSTHLLQQFGWEVLIIIHPLAQTLHPVIFIFSYTSRNFLSISVFRMTGGDKCHSGSSPRHRLLWQRIKSWSHGMTNDTVPEVYMLKNSLVLTVSVPVNPLSWRWNVSLLTVLILMPAMRGLFGLFIGRNFWWQCRYSPSSVFIHSFYSEFSHRIILM